MIITATSVGKKMFSEKSFTVNVQLCRICVVTSVDKLYRFTYHNNPVSIVVFLIQFLTSYTTIKSYPLIFPNAHFCFLLIMGHDQSVFFSTFLLLGLTCCVSTFQFKCCLFEYLMQKYVTESVILAFFELNYKRVTNSF